MYTKGTFHCSHLGFIEKYNFDICKKFGQSPIFFSSLKNVRICNNLQMITRELKSDICTVVERCELLKWMLSNSIKKILLMTKISEKQTLGIESGVVS